MKSASYFALLFGSLAFTPATYAINIPTVSVGDVGNPADTRYIDRDHANGIGSVARSFKIARTEVTNAQYTEFLNAVAASDPYELYSTSMGSSTWGGITRGGSSGTYGYSVKTNAVGQGPGGTDYTYGDKPVVDVSWYDAIRFANWLHNGQGSGHTENGAYTLLGGTPTPSNGNSITRNPGARWWLPSEDEWYKAAYFDPGAGIYYDYPTGTNYVPNNNPPSSDTGNSANFIDYDYATGNFSYPMTDVGEYMLSDSPYGTFDQGGNVWEWNDTPFDSSFRIVRGGSWLEYSGSLRPSYWIIRLPSGEHGALGFRVATIPEPSALVLAALTALGLLCPHRTRLRQP